ncbi:MAG: nuclear transport factor 2 family protein, partial [Candidatus Omnitrophota bacterium]
MKIDPGIENEIFNVLNSYAEFYAKKDMDSVLRLFTPGSDLTFIGTDINEKCASLDEFKSLLERDFAIAEDVSWQWGERSVSAAGPVAWVSTECLARANVKGQEMTLPMRITAVLEKRADRWLIAHMHNSVPVM